MDKLIEQPSQNKQDANLVKLIKQREKGIVATSSIGIGGNVVLVAMKAIIGIITGSIALIVDAVNNLTDALSSIITIIGTKLSNKKPDRKHPYGHGRVEYVTSTIIGALILFAGGMAIYESIVSIIDHFKNGTMPEFTNISLIIISVAILIKLALGIFYRIRAKQLNSDVLKASGLDSLFDAILSLGTLISAIVALFANTYIEGYVGIAIGLFILKSGFGVVRESISQIIGQRIDDETTTKIKHEIAEVQGVDGVYDLILNSYGTNKFIGSVHIGVKNNISAVEIMDLEKKIAGLMYFKHNIIMTVGIYAQDTEDAETQEMLTYLLDAIKDNPNILQIHGFYINKEINIVSFDIVLSFDEKDPEGAAETIRQTIKVKFPKYNYICNIDYDY